MKSSSMGACDASQAATVKCGGGSAITECRICDSANLDPCIDLGQQPWCNHFLTEEEIGQEPYYPLSVVYCHNCRVVQLDFTVPKEVMFSNHTYLSGVTKSLGDHFRHVAAEVDSRFGAKLKAKSVLDIGSNDGTQLKAFKSLGYDVLGVESATPIAQIANDNGIPTINSFFNADFAVTLGRKFDIINAAGVFFHLEELHSVTEGIRHLLSGDGVFIVQFLYTKLIVENRAFDQIYHEHLLYYNLETIETLLNRHGLAMFDAYVAPIHGGSIIGFVGHQGRRPASARLEALREAEIGAGSNALSTYVRFAQEIEVFKEQNLAYLERAKRSGKKIFGFGAPAKGNTLLNYFGIGKQYLDCLVEKNPLRRGLYSPGMHIPVVLENELTEYPDLYYVLAWNFKSEIIANNQNLIDQGVEFYFPINPKEV